MIELKGNPIIQINSVYSTLHNKERMIADVILKDPEKVPYLSVAELAELANASFSSIVRFCKLIGYSGYSEFKTELAKCSHEVSEMSASLHYEAGKDTKDCASLTRHMFQANCNMLNKSLEYLDYEKIEQAADAILHAGTVYICGNAYSGLVASVFQSRLKSIGIPVFLACDHIAMKQDAVTMTLGNVLLAISQSGYSRDTMETARAASEKGCTVITMTTCEISPIMDFTTIPIVLPCTSRHMFESIYSTEIAFHAMLNVLFVMLDARQNPEHRTEYENFFRELVQESVIDFNLQKSSV